MDFVITLNSDQLIMPLYDLAEEVRQAMASEAQKSLSPDTAALYTAGLMPVVPISDSEVYFTLVGWLPMAIEAGIDPFDMKPGLLRSSKAKIAKDGSKYLVVPIKSNPYSFRVVSSKSKPGSWIHPGIQARDFWNMALKSTGHGE
jgi:hypothetical protein